MKRTALLTIGLLIACGPAMARPYHGHYHGARTAHHASLARHANGAHHARVAHRTSVAHHANAAHHANVTPHASANEPVSHAGITCEMVRAYVAQVGLTQAIAMAQSAGITAAEKDRAKRCLAQKS